MSNKKNVLFKNIASLGIVQIANYVFPLVSIPIISRVIGPDKFGVINYAAAFIMYFGSLINYGFDLTATRRVAKNSSDIEMRNNVFSEVFWAKLILFTISLLIFTLCIFIIPPLESEKKVAVFSFFVCLGMVFTQNWFFQAMQDLPKVAILNFISKFIFTISVLVCVRHKNDYYLLPLLTGITQIVVALYSFFWAYKKYHLELINKSIYEILKLLWNERIIFFSSVVIVLYTSTNTVLLGIMENDIEVGYYSAGQKLIEVASNLINVPLIQAFYPFIIAGFNVSEDNGIRVVQKSLPLIMILTFIFTLILFFAGPFIIHIFYGNKFEKSIIIFQILSFIPNIILLSNFFGIQVMLNLKMDKVYFYITFIGGVLGIFLNLLFVKLWGYIGAAINWFIVEIYITGAMFYILHKKGYHPLDIKQFNIRTLKQQLLPLISIVKRKSK